jgi:hypothetical protein
MGKKSGAPKGALGICMLAPATLAEHKITIFESDSVMAIQLHTTGTWMDQGRGAFRQSVIEGVRRDDTAAAEVLERKLTEAKQAVEQLSVMRKGMAQSRKADAAEKVKRIKAEIQALRMAGGDPKMIARRIAQLARELASAAHEYAAGSSARTSADSGAPSSAAMTAGALANISSSATADAASNEDASNASSIQRSGDYETTKPERQPAEEAKAKFKEDLERRLGEINETAVEAREDQAFAQEVRSLAAQLKALAKQQEEKLKQMKEQPDNQAGFTQAMAEIETAIARITTGSYPVSSAVDVMV